MCVLASVTAAYAYRVEGMIMDEEGRPIESVMISLKGVVQTDTAATPDTAVLRDSVAAYYSCVSDSIGHFDMDGIEAGRYINVISKPGYKTA
ncbi:MAG: carboxypeptidase-like regulatory domain-containing protein [Muribaculaceae bacterium]